MGHRVRGRGAASAGVGEIPEPELRALLHLSLIPGVGDGTLARLRGVFGSGVAALEAEAEAFERVAGAGTAAVRQREAVRRRVAYGLRVVRERGLAVRVAGGRGYPAALYELHDPPQLLYLKGEEALLAAPCVAVVGSRRATEYGVRVAAAIAANLVAHGAVVVSGLAFGIDQAAHEAALDGDGGTIAVLATGADRAYPPSNRGLMERIARRGLLVSEFAPGERALRHNFPRRNRIIAALSRAVVVVEAAAGSGALITADHALELGRDVFAVPGPIDRPQSEGTNALLRDGAHVVTHPADVAQALGLAPPVGAAAGGGTAQGELALDPPPGLSTDAQRVWRALDPDPRHVDEVAQHAGLDTRRVLAALSQLELSGLAVPYPGMRFARPVAFPRGEGARSARGAGRGGAT